MFRTTALLLVSMGLLIINFRDLNIRRISPGSFFTWQIGILVITCILVFQGIGQQIAEKIGFTLLANMVFTYLIVILIVLVRNLESKMNRSEKRIELLVQEIGILKATNSTQIE